MAALGRIWTSIFGTRSDKHLKRMRPMVDRIGALEPRFEALSDADLRGLTGEFRRRMEQGEPLDALLPEAFAAVREGSRRALGMRHFDVQLLGGMVLHEGKIAEMRTGEGKTLVATLPVYLNALEGQGVHVVTVNDYLAQRDAEWMSRLYNFLGLSVGVIISNLSDEDRQQSYNCDVTYGTNNEFGFDYLRDNMKHSSESQVMAKRRYAIVDEVDSILIDEARTPLIISGQGEASTDLYARIDDIVPNLRKERDYTFDEKARMASLTEDGMSALEGLLHLTNLYDPGNVEILHHVNQALRAHVVFKRDVDYVIKDDEIVIVDEFTGRLMPGRRWSDGLHQAIEAKEKVPIQSENKTLASITFQNYFRLYDKLSGMTGTAETEAEEFEKIYGLEVVVVPTNKPLIRDDQADLIYRDTAEKLHAIVEDIVHANGKGQPVLVGTTSIEKSEFLARALTKHKIPHHVLNAKQHEMEAVIVSQAGRKGAVTIATNMAGRGTDIVLGGNPEARARLEVPDTESEAYAEALARHQAACAQEKEEVLAAGGLHIIGTERHESRRIDNQLRGRSGRQGDPGSSCFYLSLEDDLLRIFGSDKITSLMERVGMEEGEALTHPWLNRAVENAQKKLEGQHFGVRKQLTEYDAVLNEQRGTIYSIRQSILTEDTEPQVHELIENLCLDLVDEIWPEKGAAQEGWQSALSERCRILFGQPLPLEVLEGKKTALSVAEITADHFQALYEARVPEAFGDHRDRVERYFLLQTLDNLWTDHLAAMDELKDQVGLVGYAQQKPVVIYKQEGFGLFQSVLLERNQAALERLFRVKIREDAPPPEPTERPEAKGGRAPEPEDSGPEPIRRGPKIGRNDPCPCGSGKKYKKCHMKTDEAVA